MKTISSISTTKTIGLAIMCMLVATILYSPLHKRSESNLHDLAMKDELSKPNSLQKTPSNNYGLVKLFFTFL